MATISNISRYDSARELLDEFCGADFWDGMDADDICFLNHFDDFEGYTYYAIDGGIYVTDFCGGVMYSCENFNEFLGYVMDWLKDDREGRA